MAHAESIPHTQALRWLDAHKVTYTPRLYDFEEHGGTHLAATSLGLDEHWCIKTIVLETEAKNPLICLMHGDREISVKNLARFLGVKSVAPCSTDTAQRHTGYFCGGTSPFGTRKPLPIYVQKSILESPVVYINGGRRGLLVEIPSEVLTGALGGVLVDVMQA